MTLILYSESLIEVQQAIAGLADICQRIAPKVAHLNRRGIGPSAEFSNGDEDDSSTIRPSPSLRRDSRIIPTLVREEDENEVLNEVNESPSIPQDVISQPFQDKASARFSIQSHNEKALKASRPYRRAPDWDRDDITFRSSVLNVHAMSLFSKLSSLSLGEVSTVSIIALPLFCDDISNHQHYTFGELAPAGTTQNTVANGNDKGQSQTRSPSPPSPGIETQPTPHSPSLPVKAGVSRVFRAIANMIDRNPSLPTIRQPTSLERLGAPRDLSPADRIEQQRNLFYAHLYGTPSLKELSSLSLQHSEVHLCHKVGGPPCFGALSSVTTWIDDMEEVRGVY